MNGPMLCFGNSNTYGYDPRSYLGSRYPTEERWTGILKGRGWEILNCGENGREIPHRASELEALDRLLERSGRLEGIVLMLGGNDLLQNPAFAAEDVAARMEEMLGRLLEHSAVRENGAGVLLLVPPPMHPGSWVTEERLLTQSARLGGCYGALARRLDIGFADTAPWNVDLTFDGVHFSPRGHRTFARELEQVLKHICTEKRRSQTDITLGERGHPDADRYSGQI